MPLSLLVGSLIFSGPGRQVETQKTVEDGETVKVRGRHRELCLRNSLQWKAEAKEKHAGYNTH